MIYELNLNNFLNSLKNNRLKNKKTKKFEPCLNAIKKLDTLQIVNAIRSCLNKKFTVQ